MDAATHSPARTSTLTSLALLKVTIDQRRDYFDYLRPFILQVLLDPRALDITDHTVAQQIEEQFGLVIPQRTVQLVLKRLSHSYPISRKEGAYQITGDLPDPHITERQAEAEQHIEHILNSLEEFSQSTLHPLNAVQEAVDAVLAFLAEFDISCLRSYLRGTAIPSTQDGHSTSIVLVSDFVRHIKDVRPELFQSFLVLVQGHMLANALLCPDLNRVTQDYRHVTFYLDTPLLVQRLGLEGSAKEAAAHDLIDLLLRLKAKVVAFEHSVDELRSVVLGAADHIDSPAGRGAIVVEARRRGTTRSDLLLFAESIETRLQNASIEVEETPKYIAKFQIDEKAFESVLDDWVGYRNQRAKIYDINSVRSIYTIRARHQAPTIEQSKGVLVTTNHSFASAAWNFGQQHESSRDVSSVITDFTLANTAWLKAPLGAPNIPTTQLLSFAYAALEPSDELLDKYMAEIDKLETGGSLSVRDLELLRSSPRVYPELMGYTLGDDMAVRPESITQISNRISEQIRAEETDKLVEEQKAHRITQEALSDERKERGDLIANLYWRCQRKAKMQAWVISLCLTTIVVALMVVGLLAERQVIPQFATAAWPIVGISAVLTILAILNLVLGLSVRGFHGWIQKRIAQRLLDSESMSLGINLDEAMQWPSP